MEVVVMFWALFAVLFAFLAIPAAYRNGVTDGYGYAREPSCPGYKAAGEYLRNTMGHRWPELKDQPERK